MSVCPKCQTVVDEADFGLYTCRNCQTVLAVDFDGNVTISEEFLNPQEISSPVSEESGARIVQFEKSVNKSISKSVSKSYLDPATSHAQEFEHPHVDMSSPEISVGVEAWRSPAHDVNAEDALSSLAPAQNSVPPDFAQGEPYQLVTRVTEPATSSFDDVVAYGNSELSQANEGLYLYDVLIEGIDSLDLRLAVKEALRDVRFGWDVEDMAKSIRGGSLKIAKVNAVKAHIIVSRLKGYPLQLSWVQNGILDIEAT